MQIQSAFSAGMQGLQRASAGVTEETININLQTQQNRQQEQDLRVQDRTETTPTQTHATTPKRDLTQYLVRLEQQELQAQANVRSLRTADEMLGSIIDVRV